MNRREAIATMLAGGTLLAPRIARAQSRFPDRPIRIIVPVSPGGGVDTFGRLIAAQIEAQRHVQFVVENRTGGNSTNRRSRRASRRARRLHAVVSRLDALGIEPAAETPEAFAQFLHADLERSAKLLKAADFKPQ